jgi:hypothetical protein
MIRFITLTVILGLLFFGCEKEVKEKKDQQSQSQDPHAGMGKPSNAEVKNVGGIHWQIPSTWKYIGSTELRVASYAIAPAQGDQDAGEFWISYLGPGGGDLNANVDRWRNQFEEVPKAATSNKTVNGLNVVIVKIEGTYNASMAPGMETAGKKSNTRLLAAVIEGPQGPVFFKLIGPRKTVGAANGDFEALIASVAKL